MKNIESIFKFFLIFILLADIFVIQLDHLRIYSTTKNTIYLIGKLSLHFRSSTMLFF